MKKLLFVIIAALILYLILTSGTSAQEQLEEQEQQKQAAADQFGNQSGTDTGTVSCSNGQSYTFTSSEKSSVQSISSRLYSDMKGAALHDVSLWITISKLNNKKLALLDTYARNHRSTGERWADGLRRVMDQQVWNYNGAWKKKTGDPSQGRAAVQVVYANLSTIGL